MSVCWKCEERTLGCHAVCEKYKAEREEREREKRERGKGEEMERYVQKNRRRLRNLFKLPVVVIAASLCVQNANGAFLPQKADSCGNVVPEAVCTAVFEYNPAIPLTYDEQAALTEACNTFSVDRALLLGLIEQETRFRNICGDGGNSIGYCQIQPRWWSGLMQEIGTTDLTDPRDNFLTACAIIEYLCQQYGDTELALTAYNTGHSGQSKYADSVLAYTAKWSEVLYG